MARLFSATVVLVACLAAQAVAQDTGLATEECSYIIKTGDTFYQIAAKIGVPVYDIKEMNPGVDPTKLYDGQVINVPCVSCYYTIKPKDALYQVARLYGSTIRQIKQLNDNLTSSNIMDWAGQDIEVPCPCQHFVKPGEGWGSLAKLLKTTPKRIRMLNPDVTGRLSTMKGKPVAVPCPPSCNHVVKSGETFKKIARKHKISVRALLGLNPRVNVHNVVVGQIIRVPCS